MVFVAGKIHARFALQMKQDNLSISCMKKKYIYISHILSVHRIQNDLFWNRSFDLVLLRSDHCFKVCLGPRGEISQEQRQASTHSRQHRGLQVLFCTHTHTEASIQITLVSGKKKLPQQVQYYLLTVERDKTLSRRRRRKLPAVGLIGSVNRASPASKCIFPFRAHDSLPSAFILYSVCRVFSTCVENA